MYQKYLKREIDGCKIKRNRDLFYISDMADWDGRTGNQIDETKGRTAEGQLYNLSLLHLKEDFCFFMQVSGDENTLDHISSITLGGERRRCFLEKAQVINMAQNSGDKLVVTSPCRFDDSARPFGYETAMALVNGYQKMGGYDMAENKPKPLKRLVMPGAVYWLKETVKNIETKDELFRQGFNGCQLMGGQS
jgi:CRISPR type III-B/RAMP module-associated protein Cmr3